MPEERIVSVFDVDRGVTDGGREPSESLLLTSRRIIHVKGKGGRRRVVFLPLRNIDAIEIMRQPLGYGTFVWAALAVVVAVLVWQVWEHGLAPLASLIVIGMGGLPGRRPAAGPAAPVRGRHLRIGAAEARAEVEGRLPRHPRLHDPRLPSYRRRSPPAALRATYASHRGSGRPPQTRREQPTPRPASPAADWVRRRGPTGGAGRGGGGTTPPPRSSRRCRCTARDAARSPARATPRSSDGAGEC